MSKRKQRQQTFFDCVSAAVSSTSKCPREDHTECEDDFDLCPATSQEPDEVSIVE